jgi:hypothetical protein
MSKVLFHLVIDLSKLELGRLAELSGIDRGLQQGLCIWGRMGDLIRISRLRNDRPILMQRTLLVSCHIASHRLQENGVSRIIDPEEHE